jgi:hypothetical protein
VVSHRRNVTQLVLNAPRLSFFQPWLAWLIHKLSNQDPASWAGPLARCLIKKEGRHPSILAELVYRPK